ncbi:hypothetical protein [Siccirubricoccus sp. G192]|uniref:hypothetical protein n=1 Tax=Siccirubricoccus sp. G192 TaxID=2849651 RepID=UPI001C2B85E2|nr:hypothetical protein [Siccirubricoccus sp. G192]MBV1796319.1 hypothetical protein [Siccirubricoccus sp. G192]
MELNMLLRGQSNAVLLDHFGAIHAAAREAERLLGFDGVNDRINVISSHGQDSANTINSGTALLTEWLNPRNGDWRQGWEVGPLEAGLLETIAAQPADVRADPTGVVWLHNEYDSKQPGLSAAEWESAVRFDAAQLRAAFGQEAAQLPYLFVNAIPYGNARSDSNQAIKQGMATLAKDPGFHAEIAAQAPDLDMNNDGDYGGSHISWSDAEILGQRVALSFAQAFADHARPGSPVALAGGQVNDLGPEVVSARPVAGRADQLHLTLDFDAATGLAALDPTAAAGTGWNVVSANGFIKASAASPAGSNGLLVTFEQPLPADGLLHYNYGYGRLIAADGTGQGHAVYDDQGLPLWTAPEGVAIGGGALALAPQPAEPAASAGPIDWHAIAAQVHGNFALTGQWFM